ncbi:flagellar brake protein [Candidatus Methylospira mobilis]|uniref:flagellar brake protein n=1 Tax=Candidatus Methylospira mobilis TaxID=1808979 RepID=UPI001884BA82|nr:flagellar brake protein [Candidatus Methylospira mobilis]WNV04518.1 flagellar brake protein [Candidatus Methylospira mobilis]
MADNHTSDDHASYTITRRTHVVDQLMQMERLAVLIHVKPSFTESGGFMTTITKVLPAKNLFTIEISTNEELNNSLINCEELVFSTSVEGIPARFKTSKLSPATLGGKPVFAVVIPKSLYWRQRRQAYRSAIPPVVRMTCTIALTDSKTHTFQVLDISLTGFSLLHEYHKDASKTLEIGQVFQGCRFSWPSSLNTPFTAKLCRTEVADSNGVFRRFKLGFHFADTTLAFEKDIQDLQHELAQIKKRQSGLAHDSQLPGTLRA